jgi:hypothetical protein
MKLEHPPKEKGANTRPRTPAPITPRINQTPSTPAQVQEPSFGEHIQGLVALGRGATRIPQGAKVFRATNRPPPFRK